MSSIIKVDTIQDQDGNNIINESGNVITIGASGDTITVPAGATVSGFTSAGIDDNATSTAITISSGEDVTFTEDILLGDNKKAIFGAGTDLQIYHDGSNSIIGDVATGNLLLTTNGTAVKIVKGVSGSETLASFNEDSSVELYHDNSKRLETTSSGATVSNSSGSAFLRVEASSSEKGDLQANSGNITLRTIGSYPLVFNTNQTERARLDTSGRLIIAKTSTAIGDVGISLDSNGKISATRSSDPVFLLNRLSSDGTIADFRKDGTSVGSIGVLNSDNPYFQGDATNHGGLQCGTNTILPCKSSANSDNTIDLGQSDIRWKDIYLSGGAFIGGTGTANKLDDYEEGTFTPGLSGNLGSGSGVNFSIRNAFYTKVGRAVFFNIHISLSSWSSGPSGSSTIITGLPFANENTTGNNASVYIGQCNNFSTSLAPQGGYIQPNETRIILMSNDSSDARNNLNTSIHTNTLTGNEEIRISGYYQTA